MGLHIITKLLTEAQELKNRHFIFSPQLDISAQGATKLEAKESFEIHAEEFFKYTIKNNTLNEVLSDLGSQSQAAIQDNLSFAF